jgi:hypothetical protein
MKPGIESSLSNDTLYSIGPHWGIERVQELKAKIIGDALGSFIANMTSLGRSLATVILFK